MLAVTNMWPNDRSHDGVFVRDQVESLRALGVDVDIEIVRSLRGRLDYFVSIARVRRRVLDEQRAGRPYDLVHVHYGVTSLAARLVSSVPRIVTFYGSDVNSPIERWLSRLSMGRVAKRVYVSARLARTMGDDAGEVIPNGVDFAFFVPGDRAATRRRLDVGEHEQLILFGGSPSDAVKGYDVFRDVLAKLRAQGFQVRELLLTAPRQPRTEVVAKLDAADCLLFCSRYGSEGSPTVVKEAVVMGLPVVAVDVGDVSEILADVTPSAVVAFPQPWGTEAARARLVAKLAEETARVLARGSRSDGRERNSWLDLHRIAERTISVYRDVIDG